MTFDERRFDDLAAQVRMMATLATQVATHHAEISGHDDDIAALWRAQAEGWARAEKMLEGIGKSCERHTEAVQVEVRKQGDKIDRLAASRRFTSAQWTTMITTGILGVGTVVAAALTGGP